MANYTEMKYTMETHKMCTREYKREYQKMKEAGEELVMVRKEAAQTVKVVDCLLESIFNVPEIVAIQIKDIHLTTERFFNSEYYEKKLFKYIEWRTANKFLGAGVGGVFAVGAPKAANILIRKGVLIGAARGAGKMVARAAGPIGIGLAAVAIVGSDRIEKEARNKELGKIRKEMNDIVRETDKCRQRTSEIKESIEKINDVTNKLRAMLARVDVLTGKDYENLEVNEKALLLSMINITMSLAEI